MAEATAAMFTGNVLGVPAKEFALNFVPLLGTVVLPVLSLLLMLLGMCNSVEASVDSNHKPQKRGATAFRRAMIAVRFGVHMANSTDEAYNRKVVSQGRF